ncbi:MAG: methyl-accepting chemotaxis protein [Bacteroidota bacterium]|nr:methyl-accepting chemotaxis protein [Bacteroidota bacterium]
MRFQLKTIGSKITLPTIIMTIIVFAVIILYNNNIFKQYEKQDENEKIDSKIKMINKNLQRTEKKALLISSVCSEMEIVKKAYQKYYKTDSLQASSILIEEEFVGINSSIKQNVGTQAKIHFHLPPARSFIRCWSQKRGDDISAFRNTVLDISKNHKPISGIETGRGGFVIRGLAPIIDDSNKYLGSVEMLVPIDEITNNAKFSEHEEFAIFMNTDLLSIATGFLETSSGNIKENKATIGDYILVQQTSENFELENLSSQDLNTGSNSTHKFIKGNMAYAVFPIKNYSGKTEGVGVIQLNQEDIINSISKAQSINIIIGILSIVAIIIMISLISKQYISKPIKQLVFAMGRISDKEINFRMGEGKNDEVGELFSSVNKIIENFQEIIQYIDKAADNVLQEGKTIKDVSFNLSEQSNEQSATTEEVAASSEQIFNSISTNSENAKNTHDISSKSAKELELGSKSFLQAVDMMSEISEKISIISEITFQTHILSLNAGVEAARAGEEGAGFAVVAKEIKVLADRSRKASKDIINLSKNGMAISQKAGIKLKEVIPEVVKSARLVQDIVSVSLEQETGVKSISQSMQQLANATNNSTNQSETMAKAANKLTDDAQNLKNIISVFKLNE